MALEIIKGLYPAIDPSEFNMSTLLDGMADPVELIADYLRSQGVETDAAYERARQDVNWAHGEAFLQSHPRQKRRFPWSKSR